MRSLAFGLIFLLSIPAFAISTDADQPIETAALQQPSAAASAPTNDVPEEVTKSCAALISSLTEMDVDGSTLIKLRKQKAEIDKALADDIAKQYHLYGVTEMRGIQIYERVLNLLARGDIRELVPLLRPYFGNVYEQHRVLVKTLGEIKQMRATPSADAEKTLAELNEKFEAASKIFGENYGPFISLHKLLSEVKAGHEVKDATDVANANGANAPALLLNLNSARAKKAASRTLGILTSPTEQQWITTDSGRTLPHIEEIRTMFKHNLHAILAMRQHAQTEQVKSNNMFRRGVQHLANLYLNLTDRSFIPERYRKWILRLTGIAYRSLMRERYLDKIQAVVDVARMKDPQGNYVLHKDTETLELQVQTLRELNATGIGDDMLMTFAQIGYHTDTWLNLKRYVSEKAEATKTQTTVYVNLAEAMKKAEARRDDVGEEPFVYDAATRHELIFVSTQIAWLVGTEEFIRRYGIDWTHNLMNYLF